MRLKRTGIARFVLGGFASIGIVAAHQVAYLVAAPESHHREALLEHTGHGTWRYVAAFAFGLFVASMTGAISASVGSTGGSYLFRIGTAFSRLLLLQVGGYVALESAERIVAGDVVTLVIEPVFWIGLVLQISTALLGALLLGAIVKAVAWLTSDAWRLARSGVPLPKPDLSVFVPVAQPATGSGSLRGPPNG